MNDLQRRQQLCQFSQSQPRAHVFQTLSSTDVPAAERKARRWSRRSHSP